MNSNPYHVLGVTRAVSKKEIVMAKMAAMKKKQYPLNAIAEAEKALLDPQKRIIADFLLPVLPTIQRFKRADLSALNEVVVPELEFLEEFDGLVQAITQLNQISETDIQIGKALVASHVENNLNRTNGSSSNINSRFPMETCGDSNSNSGTCYPVYIEFSNRNLSLIRDQYCRDAFTKYRESISNTSIQVASFANRSDAEVFANLMKDNVGSGEVGEP